MPDMRLPYAYIESEIDSYRYKADEAREEVIRLTSVAENFESMAKSLKFALSQQITADEEALSKSQN